MRYRRDVFDDKYARLRGDRPCKTIVAHLAKDGNGYIHPTQGQNREEVRNPHGGGMPRPGRDRHRLWPEHFHCLLQILTSNSLG
jgi:hypothetical protein